ncbi:hypothetical protein C7H19_17510 [Aphanothece hegewaldii CCALA 016]|uniref:DUF433 domain-containing protein n=1 Tax=Aphanothece hegewaldii CCALA 016 TaxID=2107694 RepID=A0A2T1LUS4_9CHRO|nr:DUF433 domain-containing protein [Aphanothece hegewaldii]PSF35179.1 hypothetical protein C7H19_17510 [Aphanothece hegewaldii CCALA 016]
MTTSEQSSNLAELTPKLLNLTPKEKAEVIQILSNSLANAWQRIEKNSGVCGGKACIMGTRIPVWILVNARRLGITKAELLEDYPTISATNLANAWLYAEFFAKEIEQDIQENE